MTQRVHGPSTANSHGAGADDEEEDEVESETEASDEKVGTCGPDSDCIGALLTMERRDHASSANGASCRPATTMFGRKRSMDTTAQVGDTGKNNAQYIHSKCGARLNVEIYILVNRKMRKHTMQRLCEETIALATKVDERKSAPSSSNSAGFSSAPRTRACASRIASNEAADTSRNCPSLANDSGACSDSGFEKSRK